MTAQRLRIPRLRNLLRVVLPVLVLVGALAAAYAIVEGAPEIEPRPPDRRIPVVKTVTAKQGSTRLVLAAQGTVQPCSEVTLVMQVAGIVEHVSPSLESGGFVRKDELLVRIDRRDYELAVTQAKAGVAQAEARLEHEKARGELARREWKTYGKGEASGLAVREPQLREAQANLASAEALLARAELDLSRTELRAPFDGRVRSEQVDAGQFVSRGVPLARVYATDYAEVRLSIPTVDLPFVDLPLDADGCDGRPDAPPVRLRARLGDDEHEWTGRIARTEAEVDPRSRVVRALVRVERPYAKHASGRPPLLVGTWVRAEITGKEISGVFVLPAAVLRGRDTLHVVDEESCLHTRTVTVLRRERDRVLVTDGLREGERICVTTIDPMVEGMQVREETGR